MRENNVKVRKHLPKINKSFQAPKDTSNKHSNKTPHYKPNNFFTFTNLKNTVGVYSHLRKCT